MAGRRLGPPARGVALRADATRRQTRSTARNAPFSATDADLPPAVRQMLAEAGISSSRQTTSDAPERPLKRPRTGRRPAVAAASDPPPNTEPTPQDTQARPKPKPLQSGQTRSQLDANTESEDDNDLEFEDVEIPKPTLQTAYLSTESEDSDEDVDIQFENIEIPMSSKGVQEQPEQGSGTLNLNLTAAQAALTPSKRSRKQPISKAEKEQRIEIHRMHLLCLLAHVEKRNHWCNDPVVQGALRSVLEPKTIQFLNPRPELNQFGRTESIKNGLLSVRYTWKQLFQITEIGLRRALWAEDKADLQDYELPPNIDSCLDKTDFRKAAQSRRGSRDVGAQLSCALLRAVGVEARLVCSLQPLSFLTGGPTLPEPRPTKPPVRQSLPPARAEPVNQATSSPAHPSARARLGHPHAAAYHIPHISPPKPMSSPRRPPTETIKESPFPVYWVEVLDIGQQKWQPVDVLVTGTHFRPAKLEPPASDRRNALSYVVAFEEDGSAKDVTRRYAKAYTSKTRRMRIDGPAVPSSMEGAKWWRKALRRYRHRGLTSTLDQIETVELNAAEAREPMPRNVADFKDHPIYALERHFRRHEVLVPEAKVVGTVGAGSKGRLEKIYRRRDVRVAQSADKWYRMGREINIGAEPWKVLPKRKPARNKRRGFEEPQESSSDEDPVLGIDPTKGTPIFTFEQTHVYIPPPVLGGRVPKNKFGNLDVYVPSMVPAGGTHIRHPRAGHAAHILGVDYAPALMGFDWKGQKGTAVYNGVVVPEEAADGVRAVLQGFEDLEAQMEEEKRRRRALLTWKNWLRTLRIRRRLFEDDEYWGDTQLEEGFEVPEESEGEHGGVEEEGDEEDGGGFVLDEGGDEGGGFEPGGFEPGGFERDDYGAGGFDPHDTGPGGFEPGGFEPGGYVHEASANAQEKRKGKEPQPPIFKTGDTDLPEANKIDGNLAAADANEGGGFLAEDADVGMLDQQLTPNTGTLEKKGNRDSQEEDASNQGDSDTAPGRGGVSRGDSAPPAVVDDVFVDVPTDAGLQGAPHSNPRMEDGQKQRDDDEEEKDEFSDAPSDTTEELYMDEDGALVD